METPLQSTQDSLFNLRILLVGDVMLGRLVDQIMPDHVDNAEEQKLAWKLLEVRAPHRIPLVKKEPFKYVWSDCLPLFTKREESTQQSEESPIEPVDLNIINLETSVTTFPKKFPNKAFNYRMHPRNLRALKEAKIDYCCIANNHVLDYCEEGLEDTVNSLNNIGIKFAGAGVNLEAAQKPAVLNARGKKILCFAFSDQYDYWQATNNKPGINFIDVLNYTQKDIVRIRELIEHYKTLEQADMVIFSIHWGSNYCWNPPKQFQLFAHELIDTCHVDLLHGHSAHHIQGIEIYKGKPILYGCGDFVDDYAVDDDFRNDLGFAYIVTLDANATVKKIELVPTKIELFSVTMTPPSKERNWLITNMSQLCNKFGTTVTPQQNSNVLLVSSVHI